MPELVKKEKEKKMRKDDDPFVYRDFAKREKSNSLSLPRHYLGYPANRKAD